MQPLSQTSDTPLPPTCAREVLDTIPPMIWFIRKEMSRLRKGLSLAQFRTLVMIYQKPSACLSAVAEHIGASLPTTSRVVAGLVDQGLLQRGGNFDDRRQLSLEVTPRGRGVLTAAWSGVHDKLRSRLALLDADQTRTVVDAMAVLKGVFGALGLPDSIGREQTNGSVRPGPAVRSHRPTRKLALAGK